VVGLHRVQAVLSAEERVSYGSAAPPTQGGAGAVVESIAYQYPESEYEDLGAPGGARQQADGDGRGIESVTLDVTPGRTIALVGPTGAGKSTIAHLLVRLFDPDTGEISLDGHTLVDLDRDALAQSVSIVFQETFLFNDTIYNNITLDETFPDDEVFAAARLAQADSFIRGLENGYATIVGERGAALSGGQRQRVAIARALVRRPRLLVLDDATSAVDPAVESAILEGLRQLDTTVVIVAYRRSSIVLADEVIFVEDGRVIDRGTHSSLYSSLSEYRDLIDAYEKEPA
jgi:ABC-type multidrug transport system fused ATPase/permease subunit